MKFLMIKISPYFKNRSRYIGPAKTSKITVIGLEKITLDQETKIVEFFKNL